MSGNALEDKGAEARGRSIAAAKRWRNNVRHKRAHAHNARAPVAHMHAIFGAFEQGVAQAQGLRCGASTPRLAPHAGHRLDGGPPRDNIGAGGEGNGHTPGYLGFEKKVHAMHFNPRLGIWAWRPSGASSPIEPNTSR